MRSRGVEKSHPPLRSGFRIDVVRRSFRFNAEALRAFYAGSADVLVRIEVENFSVSSVVNSF